MSKPNAQKAAEFLAKWGDNLVLLAGVACLTSGASMFSARAGLITCGSLLIVLTIVQSVLDVKLGSR